LISLGALHGARLPILQSSRTSRSRLRFWSWSWREMVDWSARRQDAHVQPEDSIFSRKSRCSSERMHECVGRYQPEE
jgi:hypothetical protein